MDTVTWSLLLSAAAVASLHTVLGPDHTLPFVVLARARGWGMARTLSITFACGVGHLAASLLLGCVGIALGYGIHELSAADGVRGLWAAWALVGVGLAYTVWGLRRAWQRGSGMVLHRHGGHVHLHGHGTEQHTHEGAGESPATFWLLFAVFVLGPCEPLIPLFMLPASTGDWTLAAACAAVFAFTTLVIMLGVVAVGLRGCERLRLGPLERWFEALAGGVLAASGLAILFLGA